MRLLTLLLGLALVVAAGNRDGVGLLRARCDRRHCAGKCHARNAPPDECAVRSGKVARHARMRSRDAEGCSDLARLRPPDPLALGSYRGVALPNGEYLRSVRAAPQLLGRELHPRPDRPQPAHSRRREPARQCPAASARLHGPFRGRRAYAAPFRRQERPGRKRPRNGLRYCARSQPALDLGRPAGRTRHHIGTARAGAPLQRRRAGRTGGRGCCGMGPRELADCPRFRIPDGLRYAAMCQRSAGRNSADTGRYRGGHPGIAAAGDAGRAQDRAPAGRSVRARAAAGTRSASEAFARNQTATPTIAMASTRTRGAVSTRSRCRLCGRIRLRRTPCRYRGIRPNPPRANRR